MRAAVLASLLSLLTIIAPAANAAPSQASSLVGLTAVDARNKRIGVVSDVVVDVEKAEVVGLEVSHATAEGTAREIFPWQGLQVRDGKVVMKAGVTPVFPPESAQPIAKLTAAPLRDAAGKKAGDITDFMIEDGRVGFVVIHFDPSWLIMSAPAAVPLSSVEWKGDAFLAKFQPANVAAGGSQQASLPKPPPPPPPPPPAPRVRLTQLLGSQVTGSAALVVDDALVDSRAGRIVGLVARGADGQPVNIAFPQEKLKFEGGKLVAGADAAALARAPSGDFKTARQMLATGISNPSGKPAGKIEDYVVDMGNGKVQFAVASFDPDWVAQGWLAAVPVRSVQPDANGRPAMHFQLYEINRAYLFQSSSWPDLSNEGVRAAIHAKVDHL
jgi:sporulation protein YlmC with PRC-barrel domain